MKRLTIAAAAIGLVLTACSPSTAPSSDSPNLTTPSSVVTTAPSTVPDHTPVWLAVKYRSDPVDIADTRFVVLDGGSSSLVDAAFYDTGNEYMIVSLNGTAYHYCGTPRSVWSAFTGAQSLGSFYNAQIKGQFDCRTGFVPEY